MTNKISLIQKGLSDKFNQLFFHKGYLEYYYNPKNKETILIPLERIPLVVFLKGFQEAFILKTPSKFLNGKPVFSAIRGYPITIEFDMLDINNPQIIETIIDDIDLEKEKKKIELCLKRNDDCVYTVSTKTIRKKKVIELDKDGNPLLNENEQYKIKEIEVKKLSIYTNVMEKRMIEMDSSFELATWLQTAYNNVLLRRKFLDLQVILIFITGIIITILGTWMVADNYFETYWRERLGFLILFQLLRGVLYL